MRTASARSAVAAPLAGTIPSGQWPDPTPPINPVTGQDATVVPVSNYAGSFGDNYCGGPLNGGLPWETSPHAPRILAGFVRIGWHGLLGYQLRLPRFNLEGGIAPRLLRLPDRADRRRSPA